MTAAFKRDFEKLQRKTEQEAEKVPGSYLRVRCVFKGAVGIFREVGSEVRAGGATVTLVK